MMIRVLLFYTLRRRSIASSAEVSRIRANAEHYRAYGAIYRGDDERDENPFYSGGPTDGK